MKKYVYALVMFMPHVIISCSPPQSGQGVWNIATKNIFITQSIESSLDEATSIDVPFSNLDQLLDQVTILKSQASLLSQEINHLQNSLIVDLSHTEQIQSNIGLIESNFALLDISSIFTALDALQTTVVSAMDLLNTDLEIIESNIDDLAASQVHYFQTVASQLDKLDDDVTHVNSLLEALSVQFSLTTFDSSTDLVHQDLAPLESNVALLADQIANGFENTFSILDQNMLLAQTIESLADTLDVMDESDLTGTYSLLDQLDESMQTINSLTDLLIDTFQSIESSIDISESALDKSISKYAFIESRITLIIQKIEDLILDPAFSRMDHATSLLDQDISLLENAYTADLPALTESIESKLDHIIGQQYQQISDLDSMMSNFDAIASIQQNTTIISKLSLVNSLLDDTIDDAFATESYLDPATHSEQLFAITDNAQDLHEQLSYVDLIVPQISSKMVLIDDLLATTDSTLDIIDTIAQSNLDGVIALENIVDTLSLVAQPSQSISSILDIISSQEDVVISKLALVSQLIASENSAVQDLISDFQSTWTVLQSVDTKLAQAYSSLSLTDAAIDAFSYSSVFTVIDTIIANETTINSQVDVYSSLVNVLTNKINTDFSGVFTALTSVNASAISSSSMLSTINSKLSIIQTELGFPIYASDLPLTINTPGRYYLAENINYSGTSNAITINTNDVSIDLNGRTLNRVGGTGTVVGIIINNGVSNVKIFNGSITFFFSHIDTNNTSNVHISNVGIISLNGIRFFSNTRNCTIRNCRFDRSSAAIIPNGTNIAVSECTFNFADGIEFTTSATNISIENCTFQGTDPFGNGNLVGMNGTISNFLFKGCGGTGTRFAINIPTTAVSGLLIIDNMFANFSTRALRINGTEGVIKNNTIINSVGGITAMTTFSNYFVGFNTLIQNTAGNISISGANTYVGNFAFNTNAVGSPAPTNYNVPGSIITGKFVTISQRTGISGSVAPTYWHNINMLP